MEIKIEESPYGDTGAIYHGQLGMFNHYILQLQSFRKLQKTPESLEYLENDIKGYQIILNSKSENNAVNFLKIKTEFAKRGNRFKDNLAIIDYMKNNGLFEYGVV